MILDEYIDLLDIRDGGELYPRYYILRLLF
jgi:hypothetical protein